MIRAQWQCVNCTTTNILMFDEQEDGQHTCSCKKCGAPADTIAQDVIRAEPKEEWGSCSTFSEQRNWRV